MKLKRARLTQPHPTSPGIKTNEFSVCTNNNASNSLFVPTTTHRKIHPMSSWSTTFDFDFDFNVNDNPNTEPLVLNVVHDPSGIKSKKGAAMPYTHNVRVHNRKLLDLVPSCRKQLTPFLFFLSSILFFFKGRNSSGWQIFNSTQSIQIQRQH
jgi:hypothetical protein